MDVPREVGAEVSEGRVVEVRNGFIHVQDPAHGAERLPRFSMPAAWHHRSASAPDPAKASLGFKLEAEFGSEASSEASTVVPFRRARHQRQSSTATVLTTVTDDDWQSDVLSEEDPLEETPTFTGQVTFDSFPMDSLDPIAEESRSRARSESNMSQGWDVRSLLDAAARAVRAVGDEQSEAATARGSDPHLLSVERSEAGLLRASDARPASARASEALGVSLAGPDARMSDPWALHDANGQRVVDAAPAQAQQLWQGLSSAPEPERSRQPSLASATSSAPAASYPPALPFPHHALPWQQASQGLNPYALDQEAMHAAVQAGFTAGAAAAAALQRMGHQAFLSAPPAASAAQAQLAKQAPSRAQVPPPCKWFARGTCKFGVGCRFPHTTMHNNNNMQPHAMLAPAPAAPYISYQAIASASAHPPAAALQGPATPRQARVSDICNASDLSSEEGVVFTGVQVLWCDQRAFKDLPETQAFRERLEARTGLAVKAHKTAEKCIRLLQKKQHWKEDKPQPQPCRIFLVSWANAPVLVPYLEQSLKPWSKVVVLCDQCRSRGVQAAEGWRKQFTIVERIALSRTEAMEAIVLAVAQGRGA